MYTVQLQFEYVLFMSRNMPDVETLMQEWPSEFEDLLNQVQVYCIRIVLKMFHKLSPEFLCNIAEALRM